MWSSAHSSILYSVHHVPTPQLCVIACPFHVAKQGHLARWNAVLHHHKRSNHNEKHIVNTVIANHSLFLFRAMSKWRLWSVTSDIWSPVNHKVLNHHSHSHQRKFYCWMWRKHTRKTQKTVLMEIQVTISSSDTMQHANYHHPLCFQSKTCHRVFFCWLNRCCKSSLLFRFWFIISNHSKCLVSIWHLMMCFGRLATNNFITITRGPKI